jgi:hypothetical protein
MEECALKEQAQSGRNRPIDSQSIFVGELLAKDTMSDAQARLQLPYLD